MKKVTVIGIDDKTVRLDDGNSIEKYKKGKNLHFQPIIGEVYWADIYMDFVNQLTKNKPEEPSKDAKKETSKQEGMTEGMCFNNAVQCVKEQYASTNRRMVNEYGVTEEFMSDVKCMHKRLMQYIKNREWEK